MNTVSDETFVMAWEAAGSLAEVARLCGYTTKFGPRVCSNRAARLRRRGVRLRPFRRGGGEGHAHGPHSGRVRKLNLMAARAAREAL
jgi:hypothetical protein